MAGDEAHSGLASFGQEQLWLVEQAMPGTSVYNDVRAYDLYGPLDISLLRECADRLVAQHEVLRTALRTKGGRLWQYVQPVRRADFMHLVADDTGVAAKMLNDQIGIPCDLAEGSVFRVVLVRVKADHHIFAIVMHHAACDGLTHTVIRDDLFELYEVGYREHRAPITGSYIQFAEFERTEWAANASGAASWLEFLRQAAPEYGTPTDGRKRALVGVAGSREYVIQGTNLRRLLDRSADAGVTPNISLCALFAVTLSRWSGQPTAAFSMPVATRSDPRWHRTAGMFVNSMPILLDVGGNPTFMSLLGRARDAVLTALNYAYVPPAQIQAALSADSTGRDLLHQATLTVEKAASPHFRMGAVRAVERRLLPVHTTFGLSVNIELGTTSARVRLRYDEALYSADQAKRFGDHYVETIATAGTADRESDLPRWPSSDRLRLREWGQGPTRKGIASLRDRVARLVEETPRLPAAREGNRVVSYRELWEESARYARRLRELGIGAEDVVAICLPRSIRLLAAVLGTLRAGAVFMPLDSRNPPLRNARQLADMGTSALIADDYSIGGGWEGLVLTPHALAEDPDPAFHEHEPPDPDSLAYIITTSGSTGDPKGVMVTHRGLANYLRWATDEYALGARHRVPLHSSPAFDMAITSMLGPLYAGAEVHILPERLGPSAMVKHFHDDYKMVKGTPSHLSAVLQPDAHDAGRPPSVVVFGGENFPVEQARRWAAQVPGSILVNEYGPTETVVGATAYKVTGPVASVAVPIGRPIANTWVQVVDADLQPVPAGVRGEVVIGGLGVARGYYRAPALTAERFAPDPFGPEPGGRLYRTGDIGFWNAEGQLELVGRSDDQIKILGYRVEPGEVEAALTQCPGVRQAAVVTDRREGGRLAAYVVPEQDSGSLVLPEQVRDYLRQVLPPHMIPGVIVSIEALPLASSGKVDRSALPVPPRSPGQLKPDTASGSGSGAEWRAVVRAAWRTVLSHVPASDETSFFQVGGNSLMLLALLSELIEHGAASLSLTDLFRFPTIAGLANRIAALEAQSGGQAPSRST